MLRAKLDSQNNQFTSEVLAYFTDLRKCATPYLEWLSMEHYQFSLNNTRFLMAAHIKTQSLIEQGVSAELLDNYNEEKNHAKMYQHALKKIGLDVSNRKPCDCTAHFFKRLETMIAQNASRAFGVMYATETAAIFEHLLFKKLSEEICQRNGFVFAGSRIKHFHDLHLDGVEQAHKDELGKFITSQLNKEKRDPNLYLHEGQIEEGALEAIKVMQEWWTGLIKAHAQFGECHYA